MSLPHAIRRLTKMLNAQRATSVRLFFAALCIWTCGAPHDARAHGRALRTSSIAVGQSKWYQRTPNDWLVGLTFGSAVSHDQGQSFQWICDDAVGGVTNFDGIVAIPTSDTLVIGNRTGLWISRDGGCNFATDAAFVPPVQVTSVTVSRQDAARWYITTNTPSEGAGRLHTTTDNGRTFSRIELPNTHTYLDAVALSARDANIVLVAGTATRKVVGSPLFKSEDQGHSWTRLDVAEAPWATGAPQIALHPKNNDVMLASFLDVTNNTSYVLQSRDGGKTFVHALHIPEPVTHLQFAEGGRLAFVTGRYHFYMSHDSGAHFAQEPNPQGNACMTALGNRVYACGAEGLDAFSVAARGVDDALWQVMLRMPQLEGPYHCKAGSQVYDACATLWPPWAQKLGARAGAPREAP